MSLLPDLKNSHTILVTGGAGYIGSHAVLALQGAGWPVVVVDDLSSGLRSMVAEDIPFIEGNVADMELMGRVIKEHGCTAVMHFAGSIIVPESVSDPLAYYRNNSEASRKLIQVAVETDIKAFIFSSTASVYGAPAALPVSEETPTQPQNPYGFSKLITERILSDVSAAHGLAYACLRYFNVAGADPQGRAGQVGRRSTHLIKIAAEALTGKRRHMEVYGDDYDTPDGSCIRDYIHVSDLASAHMAALQHLLEKKENLILNCGYGRGASVLEVLKAVEQVSGKKLDIRKAPRRAGDVAQLVADAAKIRQTLNWTPRFDDLKTIIRSAWEWEQILAKKSL